jgi:O-antigen/teichoic acid export membrane protein
MIISRFSAVVTLLIITPLALGYLGVEQFGVWLTISAATTVMAVLDLGLGNSVMTEVAKAHSRDDDVYATSVVASAFWLLFAIAVGTLAILVPVVLSVDWNGLFLVQDNVSVTPSVIVAVSLFAIGLPFTLVGRVQAGYQNGVATQRWNVCASVLRLTFTTVAVVAELPLSAVVASFMGGQIVANIAHFVKLISRERRYLHPHPRRVQRNVVIAFSRSGSAYFLLSLVFLVTYASDNLIVANVRGAEEVATLGTTTRLFELAPLVTSSFYTALWPAFTEAQARGDLTWVKTALKRSILFTAAVAILGCVVLVLIAPTIMRIWLDGALVPGRGLLMAVGFWTVLACVNQSLGAFFSSIGRLRMQVLIGIPSIGILVTVKLIAIQKSGVEAMVWAGVVVISIFVSVPYVLQAVGFFKETDTQAADPAMSTYETRSRRDVSATVPSPGVHLS